MKVSEQGKRVQQLREHLQMNQQVFGAKAGLTTSSIFRIEDGTVTPRKSTLKQIAEKTGCDDQWLLYGKGKLIVKAQINDEKEALIQQLKKQVTDLTKELTFMKQIVDNLSKKK